MIGGLLLKKYKVQAMIIGGIILIGLLLWVSFTLVGIGKTICENKYLQESEELRKELNQMSIDSAAIVAQRDDIIREDRRKANVKLDKALKENAELKKWWDTHVPNDAVNYAYGMRK